jgi:ribose transport system permease protein
MEKSKKIGKDNKSMNEIKKIFKHREITLVLMIFALFLLVSLKQPAFASRGNIIGVLLKVSLKGIIGIGATLILVSGQLDLSVGGMVAVTCASFGSVFKATNNIMLSLIVSLIVALMFGIINGLLVTKVHLSAFIATLATMGISRGITYVLTKGTPIKLTTLPKSYQLMGTAKIIGIPLIIYIFIFLVIVFQILLTKSKIMRKVIYTGSNMNTAELSGVNTNRVIIGTFVLIGILVWIAAILSNARMLSASQNYGLQWETDLIAAAVIGGATLKGGEGSIVGTALGLILLGFVSSATIMLGVSVYWETFISYFVLLIAVGVDSQIEAKKRKNL